MRTPIRIDMVRDVIPAESKVVSMRGIHAPAQELTGDLWTCESANRLAVITIGQVPEEISAIGTWWPFPSPILPMYMSGRGFTIVMPQSQSDRRSSRSS